MPRIAPLTVETAPEGSKAALEGVQAKMGSIPNLLGTLAQSPAAIHTYLNLKDAISKGSLGDQVGESLALAVATKSSCDYCSAAHFLIGDMVGLSEEERRLNLQGKSGDPKVQVLIDLALAIVEGRGFIEDAVVENVKAAGYEDGVVLEVISIVILNLFTNYSNHIAQTEVDFPAIPESAGV